MPTVRKCKYLHHVAKKLPGRVLGHLTICRESLALATTPHIPPRKMSIRVRLTD